MEPTAVDRIVCPEKKRKKFKPTRLENAVKTRSDPDAPRKTIWKVCKIKAATMAARRACQSLNQRPTRREPGRGDAPDQGIVRDGLGQEQPRDKERAQQVSRTDPIRR
jgi:hypothetical protein